MSIRERLSALEEAAADYERGLRHAYGQQRLDISAKLERIRRQIAMLTEDQRKPSDPVQHRRRA